MKKHDYLKVSLQKYSALLLFVAVFLFSGCRGCDIEDVEEQLGNGNDDPELLRIELFGTDLAQAIELRYGAGCDHPNSFTATVEIEVRTANLVNGAIVPDPDPYWEYDEDDIQFYNNTGSNEGTTFDIEVPETGAYAIFMEIEMDNCTICCHGALEGQCSSVTFMQNGKTYCEAGKAQVAIEGLFTEQTRPKYDQNWRPPSFLLNVRNCRACNCNVECG